MKFVVDKTMHVMIKTMLPTTEEKKIVIHIHNHNVTSKYNIFLYFHVTVKILSRIG